MAYRIRTVAELVGVPRPTLVAWERRFGILEAPRTEDGFRVYSEKDLQTLLRIKAMLDSGMRISTAVDQLKSQATA